MKTKLSTELQTAVVAQLTELFGDGWTQTSFAVRSSGVGEDGAEASFAGQLETFLGVNGQNEILHAIVKCWSSSFKYQAVAYRRNHGQGVAAYIGVCVQEMVKADAAGVLFTRDPVSGNPGVMTINASYGLGEAVVSGVIEPDTIYLQRSFSDKLTVKEKIIGSKRIKIVLDSGAGGIAEEETDDKDTFCVSDEVALELGRIGLQVEQLFSDPRDIEFAVKDGQIYLLQARPITTLNVESDFELMHEHDAGLLNDRDMFAASNTGEMMPQAMTPLTKDMFVTTLSGCIQALRSDVAGYCHKSFADTMIATFCMHFFLNVYNCGYYMNEYTTGMNTEAAKVQSDIMFFGRPLGDDILEEVHRRYGNTRTPWYRKVYASVCVYYDLFAARRYVRRGWECVKSMKADLNIGDPLALYNDIEKDIVASSIAWDLHIGATNASTVGSAILTSTLAGKSSKGPTNEVLSDVAMLLSTCPDVLSANVPAALRTMALEVLNTGKADFFQSLSPEAAAEWLRSNESEKLKKLYDEFIEIHGHRCVRESELWEKPWRMEPAKFVKSLQRMVKSPDQLKDTKRILSESEAIENVKTPIGFIRKCILRFLLPIAREAVGHRENGKSFAIKGMDYLRQGYTRLAELLVHTGRLPDTELIFFMTNREIGQLIKNPSARLLNKAMRRRKLMPTLMNFQFPEINTGYPMPIEDDQPAELSLSTHLEGMPVSQGVIRAKCRVVTSLEGADSIQQGEILIARYTDIGWSPYFPLISGLCTEMGALLSHGAVVAREYGLPCIVSAKKATSIFKTGDEVILDGTRGTITKVLADDNDDKHTD
ncbi:PREDICTED: putative phosphoenolpyruvate synthase isoform X1 [Priapulus caudatus]|uniref:Phosphoenolpyruvate synthase isoform X1 n=1 Tax=Priapulus caudatus TaxID=37621 RepID=A0ABM1EL23_PRICU|nr:PREDICTED: putative phosphoenolpyruvate synthase isoform X1 [Priapulus caudatus]